VKLVALHLLPVGNVQYHISLRERVCSNRQSTYI